MKQIDIGEDSWHYRLYKWWIVQNKIKKPPAFRENLCHYARVLVWAGFGLFFTVKVYKGLYPWMIVAATVLMAGAVYAIIADPLYALVVAGVIAVALLMIAVVFLLLYLLSKLPKAVAHTILVVTMPIWGPFFFLMWIFSVIWEKVIGPIWFKSHSWTIPVWLATTVLFTISLRLIAGPLVFTKIALWVGFALSVGLTVCFAVFLLSRSYQRRMNKPVERQVERPKGISTPNLFYRVAQAKVGSPICPMINLPHQWVESETATVD